MAPKSIRELHGTVRLALQQAVDDRILERNEALLVRLPRVPRFAARVLSSAELAAFWRVARGDRHFALWYLASLFPSRAGELRALRWEDVDARARTLTVRRSLERAEDAGRVLRTKAPKTAAGVRLVELDPALLRVLQDHRRGQAAERLRAGAAWVDHGLLFTTRYGTPLDGNNIRRRFRVLLGEAGVPAPQGLRFHDLRHTSVSALIAAGVPVPEVAAIAGHATPAVTNQLYAHAVRRARGTALGEAAAFHRAQLDALTDPDAVAESFPAEDAAGAADGSAERAGAAERPAPEGP